MAHMTKTLTNLRTGQHGSADKSDHSESGLFSTRTEPVHWPGLRSENYSPVVFEP